MLKKYFYICRLQIKKLKTNKLYKKKKNLIFFNDDSLVRNR
jgi:hypothetical protein